MKNSLLLLFILISCAQNKNPRSKPVTVISSSLNTNCNYQQKIKSVQELHRQLAVHSDLDVKFTQQIIDSILPCWYGTPWNFYGTTQNPGEGAIACGYFVTTVLRDAGMQLNRIKLSQCASEEMIKALSIKNSIARFRNQPFESFVKQVSEKGKGLYIVGLDFHTGFLYNDGKEVYFIHASYAEPKIVKKEKAIQSGVLAASKYKVIGRVNLQL